MHLDFLQQMHFVLHPCAGNFKSDAVLWWQGPIIHFLGDILGIFLVNFIANNLYPAEQSNSTLGLIQLQEKN